MTKSIIDGRELGTGENDVVCEGTCDPDNLCDDCQEYYDSLCKCGGEMSSRMVGDEHYMVCCDCGRFDGS